MMNKTDNNLKKQIEFFRSFLKKNAYYSNISRLFFLSKMTESYQFPMSGSFGKVCRKARKKRIIGKYKFLHPYPVLQFQMRLLLISVR